MTYSECEALCDAYNVEEARLGTGSDWYPSNDGFGGWEAECVENAEPVDISEDDGSLPNDDDSFDACDLSEIL